MVKQKHNQKKCGKNLLTKRDEKGMHLALDCMSLCAFNLYSLAYLSMCIMFTTFSFLSLTRASLKARACYVERKKSTQCYNNKNPDSKKRRKGG